MAEIRHVALKPTDDLRSYSDKSIVIYQDVTLKRSVEALNNKFVYLKNWAKKCIGLIYPNLYIPKENNHGVVY